MFRSLGNINGAVNKSPCRTSKMFFDPAQIKNIWLYFIGLVDRVWLSSDVDLGSASRLISCMTLGNLFNLFVPSFFPSFLQEKKKIREVPGIIQ